MIRSARTGRPDAGFVIVGVVMFVLALTILGISLFGLSSYEAQLLGTTQRGHQALYDAESGMEMVKAVLGDPPQRLDNARLVEGTNNVIYACAWQWRPGGIRDSTGPVQAESLVTIQVVARRQGLERRVLARFQPGEVKNHYKRLFTIVDSLSNHVVVQLVGGPLNDNRQQPALSGSVWQNGTDSSWVADVTWPGRPPLEIGGVPMPDLPSYFASHLPTHVATRDTTVDGTSLEPYIPLLGAGTRYYLGGPNLLPGQYWKEYNSLRMRVQGTAIWMLPGGMRVANQLRVEVQGASATLVLIAAPSGVEDDPNTGLWLFGGLSASDSLRLVIVSSGRVVIENFNNSPQGTAVGARSVSIYAQRLFLMSPLNAPIQLRYSPAMNGIIDALVAQNALPSPLGTAASNYTMVAGSWRDRWP